MKLFDIILKLIKTLGLVSSDEYQLLHIDVKEWELSATEDNEDKLKSMYARLHKGVFFRLLTPFLYFFMLKWVRDLTKPEEPDFLD